MSAPVNFRSSSPQKNFRSPATRRELAMESSDESSGVETVTAHQIGDNRKVAAGKVTKKRKRKVKTFKRSWMLNTISGTKVSLWLKPDPKNLARAICRVCPAVTSFSINEGWSHIVQHNKGKLHNEKLLESQTNPLFKQVTDDHQPEKLKLNQTFSVE